MTTLSRTIRFPDGSHFVRLNAMALAGMSAAAKTMSDEERERIVAAVVGDSVEVARRYSDENALAFEMLSNLATARA